MHRGRRVEKDRHSLFSHKWRPPSSIVLWPAILLHVVHTSPILRAIKLGFCQMKWCSIIPTKLSDINYNPSWERYYPSFFTKFHTWGFQVLNVQHCPCYTSDNTSGFSYCQHQEYEEKVKAFICQSNREKSTYFTIYFPIHSRDHFDKILKHHGSYKQRQGETQLISRNKLEAFHWQVR